MNLPNKLTVIRMIAVPVFLAVVCIEFPHHTLVALVLFCLASLTDYFDGKLARKNNLITNFGKFLDPLADKMLTTSALLAFMVLPDSKVCGILWVTFITLLREFLVSGIRLAAVADGGKVVAANMWGKAKTVTQMVAVIFVLALTWVSQEFSAISECAIDVLWIVGTVLVWLSAVLTVISGAIYVKQNASFIDYRN